MSLSSGVRLGPYEILAPLGAGTASRRPVLLIDTGSVSDFSK